MGDDSKKKQGQDDFMDMLTSGEYIFKYMPFNLNTLKSLIKGEIWFGPLANFNDPHDGDFVIKTDKDNVELRNQFLRENFKYRFGDMAFDGSLEHEAYINQVLKNRIKKENLANYGISCFTRVPNQTLMWSHYAEGHTGICLGFEKKELLNSFHFDGYKCNDVKTIEFDSDNYINRQNELKLSFTKEGACLADYESALKYKQEDWKYEQEIRLYLEFLDDENYRSLQFDKTSLKFISFGLKMKEDDKYTIKQLINRDEKYNQTLLLHARMSDQNEPELFPNWPFSYLAKKDFYKSKMEVQKDYEMAIQLKKVKRL